MLSDVTILGKSVALHVNYVKLYAQPRQLLLRQKNVKTAVAEPQDTILT